MKYGLVWFMKRNETLWKNESVLDGLVGIRLDVWIFQCVRSFYAFGLDGWRNWAEAEVELSKREK